MSTNKRKGHRHPNSIAALKPIKPGEVRNPEGARAHDPIKKELKKFTQKYMRDTIEVAFTGNIAALQAIVKNPNSPAFQVGLAKALANAITRGDWGTLESIAQRVVGKIPDRIHLGSDENSGIAISFVKAKKNEGS